MPNAVPFIADCGCQAYTAPTGKKMIDAGEVTTTCMECAGLSPIDILAGMMGDTFRLPEGGWDEVRSNLGDAETDRVQRIYPLKEGRT